jgi:hypothetical protein
VLFRSTGRKQDKATAEEVNLAKNTRSSKAASVYKSLFVGDADLEAINSYAGKVRTWLYSVTLPWSDSGTRLVPTKAFFDISHDLTEHEKEFDRLVSQFVFNYSVKISSQAFKLGKLFDPAEYPTVEAVSHKFALRYHFTPVPEAGDFRVDIPAQAAEQLKSKFEAATSTRVREAMQEPWDRLYEEVQHIRDKMIAKEDGKPQKLYQSMLDNALGLCSTLKSLNILDDPDLEAARRTLELSLTDVDIKSLRESPEMRTSIITKMDELKDKFSLDI